MAEDEMKRSFNMTKADLCMFASILANTLTRDIADLTPFGVTTAKITELKTLGGDYEVFPSDDYLVGTMMIATDEKNAKTEEVQEAIRQLAARVEAKWCRKPCHRKFCGNLAASLIRYHRLRRSFIC